MTRRRCDIVAEKARGGPDHGPGIPAPALAGTANPVCAAMPMRKRATAGMSNRLAHGLQPQTLLAFLLLFLCALLAGCATVPSATLSGAAALAKAGQAAAAQMEENVTISEQSLNLFRKAAAFNDGFNGAPGASTQVIGNVERIQRNLAQYGNLLQSLAAVYSSMEELAEYGASPSFDAAIGKLASDAQQFGKQTGKAISIPAAVTKGIQEGGNVLVGSVQTDKAVKASRQIDAVLQQVIATLSEPQVRSAILPIQAELKGVVSQAAFTIYTQGVYSYGPILNAFGAPLGLDAVPDADAIVRKNNRLKAGLSGVVNETVDSQIAAAQQTYDLGLAALRALVKQHQKLEAREPVTLHNILGAVSRLRALAQIVVPQ